MMRRLSDRPRSVVLALAGILAIGALVVLAACSRCCPELACTACIRAHGLLDPGHGGDDPGAINDAAGLVERELVLDIARRTQARLEQAGYSVALTRSDPTTGYANTPRGQMANLRQAAVYVSLHLNSFGEPEPNYAKTFWGREEKDAAFGAVMQAALVSRLQPGTDLGDSGLEVLENGGLPTARMPAVLVEPVFLSNSRKLRASPTRVGNGWRRLRRRWPRASMLGCDRSGLGRSRQLALVASCQGRS